MANPIKDCIPKPQNIVGAAELVCELKMHLDEGVAVLIPREVTAMMSTSAITRIVLVSISLFLSAD
jgi:hypothetical protein